MKLEPRTPTYYIVWSLLSYLVVEKKLITLYFWNSLEIDLLCNITEITIEIIYKICL